MTSNNSKSNKTNINKSLPYYDLVQKVKNSISPFQSKSLSRDQMTVLSITETDYPIIPVENKCFLIAVKSKHFTGIKWVASWFEVVSIYRDKDSTHHVRLKVNGEIIKVNYEMLYPKDITHLTSYGIIFDHDHTNEMSKYIFKTITKLHVEDQTFNIGFVERDENLEFDAYDMEPLILQYAADVTMDDFAAGINKLLTNSAIMLALSCSCASLFLAYLSMKCGITLKSFIISFYGKSTTGKSTAQTMMASVYTKPDDDKVYTPYFGTNNAIIKKNG